jgi:hypothetical protein
MRDSKIVEVVLKTIAKYFDFGFSTEKCLLREDLAPGFDIN